MVTPLSPVLSAYPYRTLKKMAGSIVLTKPSYSDRKSRSFRPPHRPRLLQMQQTTATEEHYCLYFYIIKAFRSEVDSFGHRVHRTPTASHIYLDTTSHHHLSNMEAPRNPNTPSIMTICMMIWNFSSKPQQRKATVTCTMTLSRSYHIQIIHWVLHTNKCTNCISYISLKLFTLNTFTAPSCYDGTSHIIIKEHV
jgi:hypothetical protein